MAEDVDKIKRAPKEIPRGVDAWWKSFPEPVIKMELEASEWKIETASPIDTLCADGIRASHTRKVTKLKRLLGGFFKSWNTNEQKISRTLPPLLRRGSSSLFRMQRQPQVDAVPQRILTMHQAWTFEYERGMGKFDLGVDETGGVGAPSGGGDGDMTGVIIRDFAQRLGESTGTIRQILES